MTGARDTICALASGPPPAAICVIRVSGPAVAKIGAQLLESGLPEPRRSVLTNFTDLAGEWIDEGLALYAKSPHSYTGEDTLELYLHGGVAVIAHALAALTAFEGVRLAEPGEFTRRAFEAGKLDLTEAEGVADLIEAETMGQKAQALRQVAGGLSDAYAAWRDQLTGLIALTEVMIDFPDEGDVPETAARPLADSLAGLADEIRAALGDDGIGERIRDGFRIVIIGAPNAGKSTLLNRLAGRDAAIVTETPGTTRDVIEVRRMMGGQIVWISDTAGLRETGDAIEAEGIRRARAAAAGADLRILLVGADDLLAVGASPIIGSGSDMIVVNKADLGPLPPNLTADFLISAKTGEGMIALEAEIARRIAARASAVEAPVITRARHREKLSAGLVSLDAAQDALACEAGFELVAEDLRLAVRHLAGLIGTVDVEDVLGAVFSRFCIGK